MGTVKPEGWGPKSKVQSPKPEARRPRPLARWKVQPGKAGVHPRGGGNRVVALHCFALLDTSRHFLHPVLGACARLASRGERKRQKDEGRKKGRMTVRRTPVPLLFVYPAAAGNFRPPLSRRPRPTGHRGRGTSPARSRRSLDGLRSPALGWLRVDGWGLSEGASCARVRRGHGHVCRALLCHWSNYSIGYLAKLRALCALLPGVATRCHALPGAATFAEEIF
jgi:hypothetical protein